jgi:hypothetical protein
VRGTRSTPALSCRQAEGGGGANRSSGGAGGGGGGSAGGGVGGGSSSAGGSSPDAGGTRSSSNASSSGGGLSRTAWLHLVAARRDGGDAVFEGNASGDGCSRLVFPVTLDDAARSGSFAARVTAPSGASLRLPAPLVVVRPLTLGVVDGSVRLPADGAPALLRVALSGPSKGAVSVRLQLSDGALQVGRPARGEWRGGVWRAVGRLGAQCRRRGVVAADRWARRPARASLRHGCGLCWHSGAAWTAARTHARPCRRRRPRTQVVGGDRASWAPGEAGERNMTLRLASAPRAGRVVARLVDAEGEAVVPGAKAEAAVDVLSPVLSFDPTKEARCGVGWEVGRVVRARAAAARPRVAVPPWGPSMD